MTGGGEGGLSHWKQMNAELTLPIFRRALTASWRMWCRSIADSSNTATVKKNQNHGSRSRRQPHGKFQPPCEGKVRTRLRLCLCLGGCDRTDRHAFPTAAKKKPGKVVDARLQRSKIAKNEPDAKAILPEPRGVKKTNFYQ